MWGLDLAILRSTSKALNHCTVVVACFEAVSESPRSMILGANRAAFCNIFVTLFCC